MGRYIIIIVISMIPVFSNGEQLDVAFSRISPEEGLVADKIQAIGQDKNGYIWIYGGNRIIRYDGHDYKYYDYCYSSKAKLLKLSFPKVKFFIEDLLGRFVAFSEKGKLYYYNKELDSFFEWELKFQDGTTVRKIQTITNINKNTQIILADGILSMIDSTGVCCPLLGDFEKLGNSNQISLFNNSNKAICFNSNVNVAFKVDLSDNSSIKLNFSKSVDFDKIICDWQDNIWCLSGKEQKVCKFDPEGMFLKEIILPSDDIGLNVNVINDVSVDSQEKFWLATNAGIYLINPKTNELNHLTHYNLKPSSLIHNFVSAIFNDKDGGMWIGTSNGGLSYTHRRITNFSHYKILTSDRSPQMIVNSFAEDKNGNVFIATTYNGIWVMEKKSGELSKFNVLKGAVNLELLDIKCMAVIKNKLWFGTLNEGIYNIDLSSKIINHVSSLDLAEYSSIIELSDDHLMIAGRKNVITFNLKTGIRKNIGFYSNRMKIRFPLVLDIFKTHDGLILAGTYASNIYFYDSKKQIFSVINTYNEYLSEIGKKIVVEKLVEDDNNNVWAITRFGGILKIDSTRKRFNWSQKSGRFNLEIIKSIVADQFGNLWLSSINGVHHLNIEENRLTHFNSSNGLQSDVFQPGASYRASDNRIFFGGVNGFNAFYPDNIPLTEKAKNVQLSSFYVNNNEIFPNSSKSILKALINTQKKLKLNYNQRNFSISFNSFDYLNSGKMQYRYKLDGFDTDWRYTDSKNKIALYDGVSPGDYSFIVAASIDDKWEDDIHKEIAIVILPPWWKSQWAIIAYVLFVAFITILFYRIIRARIILNNRLRIEKIKRIAEEEATKAKLKFFTNVSHEFRTPLTLIAAPVEKLRKKKDNDDDSKMLISVIHQNTQRLLKLINQLLDFRKLEKDYLPLRVSKLDMPIFIKKCTEPFMEKSQKEGITLTCKIDPEIREVWFDSEKIETVIYNLLSNSFKFTPKGGNIKLEVKPHDHSITIIIEDTGKGMDQDQISHIFDRFYQASDNNSLGGGTGIGLSIVKEYIDLHGGAIQVQSQLGKGAKFQITLPVEKGSYLSNQLVSVVKTVAIENLTFELNEDSNKKKFKNEADQDASTILIVEDNKEMRDFILYSLTDSFKVIEAEDGNAGLKMSRKYAPDLIVSDVRMPGIDGIEMCQTIKKEIETSHIPVILLTAKSSVEDQVEGIGSGADLYLTKPFSTDVLEANIKQLIGQRKKLAKKFKTDLTSEVKGVSPNLIDQNFLKGIIEAIKDEITNPDLNVKLLSKKVGFNHQQLYRKLKAISGQTVNEFIRTIRLKHAAKLLINTQLTVSEIAYESGFSNHSYFTNCFNGQFNLSPKEYREANKV